MRLRPITEFVCAPKRVLLRYVLVPLVLLNLGSEIQLLVDKKHAHTAAELLPGFWTLFGLLGCIAIILLSKWFGHTGIMTREDYYDE